MIRIISTLLLLLGFSLPLFSQQYSFQNFSVSEGLAQSQVFSMLEDQRGFLWLGTFSGGLSRFDGQKFETFSTRQGLSDNHITCLLEDQAGHIWVATRKGLDRFDGRHFTSIPLPITGKTLITSLMLDEAGILWIGSNRGIFVEKMSNGWIRLRSWSGPFICFLKIKKEGFGLLCPVG